MEEFKRKEQKKDYTMARAISHSVTLQIEYRLRWRVLWGLCSLPNYNTAYEGTLIFVLLRVLVSKSNVLDFYL